MVVEVQLQRPFYAGSTSLKQQAADAQHFLYVLLGCPRDLFMPGTELYKHPVVSVGHNVQLKYRES